MFFDSWNDIARVLVMAPASYVFLILALRITGKRTLSKLNAFDLVVTIALGSTLSTILLSSEVSYAEGCVALASLVALQWIVAKLAQRSAGFRGLVKAEPTLLFRKGEFLHAALARERVLVEEVRQAMRSESANDPGGVEAVILETDGSLSVIKKPIGFPDPAILGGEMRPGGGVWNPGDRGTKGGDPGDEAARAH